MGSHDSRNNEKTSSLGRTQANRSPRASVIAGVLFAAIVGLGTFAMLRTSSGVATADLLISAPDFVVYAPSLSRLSRSLDIDTCRSAAQSSHFATAMTELTGLSAASLAEVGRLRGLFAGDGDDTPGIFDPIGLLDGAWVVSGQWQKERAPMPPEKLFGTPDLRAPFPYARIVAAVRPTRQKTLAAIAEILDPLVFERFVRKFMDPSLSIANYDGVLVCGNPSGRAAEFGAPFRDPPAIAVTVVGDCVVFGTVADVCRIKRGKRVDDKAAEAWISEAKDAVVSARVQPEFFERAAAGARFFLGDAVTRTIEDLVGAAALPTSIHWTSSDRLELSIDAPIAPRFSTSPAPHSTPSPVAWAALSIGAAPRAILKPAALAAISRDDDRRFAPPAAADTVETGAPIPADDEIDRAISELTPTGPDGVSIEWLAPEEFDATPRSVPLDAYASDIRIAYRTAADTTWPPKATPPFSIEKSLDGNESVVSFGFGDSREKLVYVAREGDWMAISSRAVLPQSGSGAQPPDAAWARCSIDGDRLATYLRSTEVQRRRADVTLSRKEAEDIRLAVRRHLIETAKKSAPTTEEIESLAALWTATTIANEREPRADRRRRIFDFLADWAPNVEASATSRDGGCRISVAISNHRGATR